MSTLENIWSWVVLGVVLIVGAITDVRSGKVYNWTTYPAIAAGLIGHTLFGGLSGYEETMGLTAAMGGLAVGFIPMFVCWKMGGVGAGDVKLMAAVGALGGWRFVVAAMFYGFLVAALMGLFVMLRRRIFRETIGRIVRFLFFSAIRAHPPSPAGPDSPTIPFGLGLCVGSGLALLEVIVRGPFVGKFLLGI